MNPFTAIPPKVRQGLYLAYACAGLILGALQVYGTEQLGDLDVSKCLEVLAYIGVPLGFTAASNTPSYQDVVEGDAPRPERGAVDVVTILVVCLVVVLILVLLGFLR